MVVPEILADSKSGKQLVKELLAMAFGITWCVVSSNHVWTSGWSLTRCMLTTLVIQHGLVGMERVRVEAEPFTAAVRTLYIPHASPISCIPYTRSDGLIVLFAAA